MTHPAIIEILPRPQAGIAFEDLQARLRNAPRDMPFTPRRIEALGKLSALLLNDAEARLYPELQALGFWLRKNAVLQMQARLPQGFWAPLGLTLHFPPKNVDTMFVYSWALAFIMGNTALIRLPGTRGGTQDLLCRLIGAALAETGLSETLIVISYAHDNALTSALSALSDCRVIWGGDAAVAALRALPLPPRAREIAFPNRFSWAAIKASAWRQASDAQKAEAIAAFYNDIFWFDQFACAAPAALVWVGGAPDPAFYEVLAEHAASKGYRPDLGGAASRPAALWRSMLDLPVTNYAAYGENLRVLSLEGPQAFPGLKQAGLGYGTLFEIAAPDLSALAPYPDSRDQTLAQFGFDAKELHAFVAQLCGRGIDRIVPFGQALSFGPLWDGYDLLTSFGKIVDIPALSE